MAGFTDQRPPLPDWIYECYVCVREQLCELEFTTDGKPRLDREDAIAMVVTDCETELEPEDAEYALTRLLDHGYLYQVNSKLRLTIPDEQCSCEEQLD